MIQRLLAALVALSMVLPIIIWGGPSGTAILVGGVLLLVLHEYASMAVTDKPMGAFVVLALTAGGVYATTVTAGFGPAVPVLTASALLIMSWAMIVIPETQRGAMMAAHLGLGLVYTSLLVYLPLIRELEHGLAWLFLVLFITWMGDTGAYFAGRAFGRRKLFERVSPKKTWEGVAGGVALAVVSALVIRQFWLPHVSLVQAVVIGAVVCGAGVLGDLVESMLKRGHGVKDSGRIMPGHGGMLDRVDSLLFAGPVAYFLATIWVGAGS